MKAYFSARKDQKNYEKIKLEKQAKIIREKNNQKFILLVSHP